MSPDGLVAASAGNSSGDETVRVWDLRRGVERHVHRGQAEEGGRTPLAITSDGRTLLTGYDGEVRAFDVVTSELRPAPLVARKVRVTALAAATAAPVCLAGLADGTVSVLDVERGGSIDVGHETEAVLAVCLTADGTRAAVGTASVLTLIELTEGAAGAVARKESETGLAGHYTDPALTVSSDGRRVYHGAPTRTWLVDDDEVVPSAVSRGLRVLAVTPGGRAICAPDATAGSLVAVEVEHEASNQLPAHPSPFSAAAVTPDGVRAVCGDGHHRITVWDLDAPGVLRATERHSSQVQQITIADGYAVSTAMDRDVKVWTLEDGCEADEATAARVLSEVTRRRDDEVSGEPGGPAAVTAAVKYSEAEEPFEPVGGECIRILTADGSVHSLVGHMRPVNAHPVSPDGRLVVSGGNGWIVRIWDLAQDEQLYALAGHTGPVRDIKFVSGSERAVSVSEDRTVVLWDVARGVRLATFTGDDPMLCCAVASDGRHVVAGDQAGYVHVLRMELAPER